MDRPANKAALVGLSAARDVTQYDSRQYSRMLRWIGQGKEPCSSRGSVSLRLLLRKRCRPGIESTVEVGAEPSGYPHPLLEIAILFGLIGQLTRISRKPVCAAHT